MKQVIAIGTTKERRDTWCKDLLISLDGYSDIPIKIYESNDFELSVIKMALDDGYDEILFLPDSTVVENHKILNIIFKDNKGKSVSICRHPCVGGMYLMKYRAELLNKMYIPKVPNKEKAIFWEIVFNMFYAGLEDEVVVLFPDMYHSNIFVEKYGRLNMVMGNQFIKRFKGNWGQG